MPKPLASAVGDDASRRAKAALARSHSKTLRVQGATPTRRQVLEAHEAKASTASRDGLSRIIQKALADSRPLVPAADLLRRRSIRFQNAAQR